MFVSSCILSAIAGFFLQSISLGLLKAVHINLLYGQLGIIGLIDLILVGLILLAVRASDGRGLEGLGPIAFVASIGVGLNLGFFVPFIAWAIQSVSIVVR